jgi:signal transduction histidine kinase
MKNSAFERTVREIRRPLTQAVAHLSEHSSGIRETWTRLLEASAPCEQHASALSGLHLAARLRDLTSADPRTFKQDSELRGQELARRGVPAECVAAAISFYVESCLPYLLSSDGSGVRWTKALTRWSSLFQFFLLSGYSLHEAEARLTLQEKIGQAEGRAHAFSVEIANTYEKERRRLAQDLHDEIGHDLIVLKLYTQVIALDLKKGDIAQVRRKLKESVSLIKHALLGVRHLTFDLGPAIWNEQGFLPAIRLYLRQFAARTGLEVSIRSARLKVKLPASYETALYKVLQGALSNIAAHAEAKRVTVTLEARRDCVVMKIEDNGKGFNVKKKLSTPPKSYGLRAMQDRIGLLGGNIHFSSQPARRQTARSGTSIEFHLPLPEGEKP